MIVSIQQERLLQLGEWLEINGEGIYDTIPWIFQNDTETEGIWFTSRPTHNLVYAVTLNWPKDSQLDIAVVDSEQVIAITLLGSISASDAVKFENRTKGGMRIIFPNRFTNKSKWGWILRIETTQIFYNPMQNKQIFHQSITP